MKTVIERFELLLKPLGFKRRKALWNRRVDGFIDVVEVQVSKGRDTFTVNVGVMDTEVRTMLWGSEPAKFVEQPECTVAERIGSPIDRKDLWWTIGGPGVDNDAAEKFAAYALPFFDRLHTRAAMRQWLIDTNVTEKRYPPPIVSLAILESLLGDGAQGCAILAELEKSAVGAWSDRVTEVAGRLGCTSK